MEYYSAIKKNGVMPVVETWMDLESTMLSEVSQRRARILYNITYMCGIIQKYVKLVNKSKKEGRLSDTEKLLVVTMGKEVGKMFITSYIKSNM